MNVSIVHHWFKKNHLEDFDLQDKVCRGYHFVIYDEQLKLLVEYDPTKTIRQIAHDLNVEYSSIVRHLEQIGKLKKFDKWVLHELNDNSRCPIDLPKVTRV